MARCVNEVYCLLRIVRCAVLVERPVEGNGRRLNGDAALSLKLEEVRDGVASVDILCLSVHILRHEA